MHRGTAKMMFSAIKSWILAAWHILPPNFRLLFWKVRGKCVPYQSVVFGGRVVLRGTDRSEAYRLIFPSPPIGRSVLDVGCHSGFYCFMAASEGAKDCLGVDINERHLSRAKRVLKRYNIPNVHFINEDALEYKFPRAFDVVLCLNLLQHLGTLDRVDALLKALLDAATGEVVLIFPTTRTPDQLYANESIDGKLYLLLSVKYLVERFCPTQMSHVQLPAHIYGPNRELVRIVNAIPRFCSVVEATE
jgi:SAM-dependent methyltransferase